MKIATYNVNGVNGRLPRLLDWLSETTPDVVCVLAGDFNVVPTDADIYDAKLWRWDAVMQPQSRDAYRRLLAQGWADSARRLHPDEVIYTYWDYGIAFRRNQGFRMDFLLLSPALRPRLQQAGVDVAFRARDGASDHAPTWIVLDAAPDKPRPARRTRRDPRVAAASGRSKKRR